MEEVVVDTNVLIYDTFEDSVLHKEAKKLLDKIERQIIPSVVLEEFIIFLVKIGVSKDFTKRKIKEILTSERVELIPLKREDFKFALHLISGRDLSFRRINDKLILSLTKRRKIPLATFDAELKKECLGEKVKVYR